MTGHFFCNISFFTNTYSPLLIFFSLFRSFGLPTLHRGSFSKLLETARYYWFLYKGWLRRRETRRMWVDGCFRVRVCVYYSYTNIHTHTYMKKIYTRLCVWRGLCLYRYKELRVALVSFTRVRSLVGKQRKSLLSLGRLYFYFLPVCILCSTLPERKEKEKKIDVKEEEEKKRERNRSLHVASLKLLLSFGFEDPSWIFPSHPSQWYF